MTLPLLATTILLGFTLFTALLVLYQMKAGGFHFLFGLQKPSGDVFCPGEATLGNEQLNDSNSGSRPFCTATVFGQLLEDNPQLILLEPDYLLSLYLAQSRLMSPSWAWKRLWGRWLSLAGKEEQHEEAMLADWKDLQWRFDLPADGFGSSVHSLTVGLIAWPKTSVDGLFKSLKSLGGFTLIEKVSGAVHHDQNSSNVQPLHYFLAQGNQSEGNSQPLLLHIVVLHRLAEFLWVGAVPIETRKKLLQQQLTSANSTHLLPSQLLHFGTEYEQIFDPFSVELSSADGHHLLSVPDDIGHFLSQLPTSRYLYCPPERGDAWFAKVNLSPNKPYELTSIQAYRELKALARHLRMEVWIAAGTLLGWHRQCTVTPYTSDTDFATWAKYAQARTSEGIIDINSTFTQALEALDSKLGMLTRFGEPTATLEYSFLFADQEKVDLFFTYSNGSHLMTPLHAPVHSAYTYNVYPKYDLCSVALLGVKLLAPCDPEAMVVLEYGSTWQEPITPYHYLNAPLNTASLEKYNFSGQQFEQFSGKPLKKKKHIFELVLQKLASKLFGYF